MTLNLAMFAHQYSVSYLSLLSLEQGWMRLHNHTRFVALVCPFFRTWVNDYLYYMLKAQAIYIGPNSITSSKFANMKTVLHL